MLSLTLLTTCHTTIPHGEPLPRRLKVEEVAGWTAYEQSPPGVPLERYDRLHHCEPHLRLCRVHTIWDLRRPVLSIARPPAPPASGGVWRVSRLEQRHGSLAQAGRGGLGSEEIASHNRQRLAHPDGHSGGSLSQWSWFDRQRPYYAISISVSQLRDLSWQWSTNLGANGPLPSS